MKNNTYFKKFISIVFTCHCLLLAQLPIAPKVYSSGEAQFHESSTKLVFTARSRDRYISQLTLVAASLVSMYQLQRCTNPAISCGVSTIASALAGVALLAGEITNIATHKNILANLKYNASELNEMREKCLEGDAADATLKKEVNDENCSQFSAIIAQRDAYVSLNKALQAQLILRGAAGLAYLTAMGFEITAAIKKVASDSAIVAAASAAQATCPATAAGPQAAVCGESVARCETALAGFQAYMTGKFLDFNSPAPSPSMLSCSEIRAKHAAALKAVQIGCAAGCCAGNVGPLLAKLGVETVTLNCMANFQSCDLGCQPELIVVDSTPVNPDKKWLKQMLDILVARSYAEGDHETSISSVIQQIGSSLSLGAFGVTTIVGLIGAKKYAGDTLFSTSTKRSIWYGVLGAIVSASAFHTQEAINEVNGHINSLNGLLSAGNKLMAADTKVSGPKTQSTSAGTVNENFEDSAEIEYGDMKPIRDINCPDGGDGKSNCLELPGQLTADLKEMNLNDIAGVSSNINDLGNELMKKDGSMKTALKLAKKINGKRALIEKFVDDAKKKLLEFQEENGIPATDFDKEIAKVKKSLLDQTSDELQKVMPSSGTEALASTKPVEEKNDQEQTGETVALNKDDVKNEAVEEDSESSGITFNLGSSKSTEQPVDFGQNSAEQKRKANVLTSGSLVSRDKSLFKAITLRYQRTGYAALLEEY